MRGRDTISSNSPSRTRRPSSSRSALLASTASIHMHSATPSTLLILVSGFVFQLPVWVWDGCQALSCRAYVDLLSSTASSHMHSAASSDLFILDEGFSFMIELLSIEEGSTHSTAPNARSGLVYGLWLGFWSSKPPRPGQNHPHAPCGWSIPLSRAQVGPCLGLPTLGPCLGP